MRRVVGEVCLSLAGLLVAAATADAVADTALPGRVDPPTGSYVADEVMVAPRAGAALEAVAARHGLGVARDVGPSGYGALRVSPRMRERLLSELHADPDVASALPMGRTFGTGRTDPDHVAAAPPGVPGQWHLEAADASSLTVPPTDRVVVALLDTGVAYEDRVEGTVHYVQAPSLRDVRFVAPWDFIHGDAHPNDDHQHGTHIASLISSMGAARGIAPGTSLMPLKVLDDQDVGTELALVDGIRYAVDHGADVINMSLSFGPDYVPSEALVSALERAAAANVVLVSAAGNEGGSRVTQPAANPLVIAVGAIRPTENGTYVPAAYANASPRVDLVAPGGSVDADRNHDGYLDGLLAETIGLRDPAHIGYWLYAGTSQAAALVSGTAAILVQQGVPADRIRAILQASSAPNRFSPHPFVDGYGRGRLDVRAAIALATTGDAPPARDPYVSLLAWLEKRPGGLVRPAALVTVLGADATRMNGVEVAGMLDGPGGGVFHCVTTAGSCRIQGDAVTPRAAEAWAFRVEDVIADGVASHPGAAMFANSGLQGLIQELGRNADLQHAVLGFRWSEGTDPSLGALEDAHLLVNLGVGKATSPSAFLLTPGAFADATLSQEGTLVVTDARGAGSPSVRALRGVRAGAARYELYRFPARADANPGALPMPDGLEVFSVGAEALHRTPLALSARSMLAGNADGYAAILVGTGPNPGPLPLNRRNGVDLAGTPLGDWLRAGGWSTRTGDPVAPRATPPCAPAPTACSTH
jgi:hypothetical protein